MCMAGNTENTSLLESALENFVHSWCRHCAPHFLERPDLIQMMVRNLDRVVQITLHDEMRHICASVCNLKKDPSPLGAPRTTILRAGTGLEVGRDSS